MGLSMSKWSKETEDELLAGSIRFVSTPGLEDPRSPCGKNQSFERTPINLKNTMSNNVENADSFMFVKDEAGHCVSSISSFPKQSINDPRSPTCGVQRTPICLAERESCDSLKVQSNFSNLQVVWDVSPEVSPVLREDLCEEIDVEDVKTSTPKAHVPVATDLTALTVNQNTTTARTPLGAVRSPLTNTKNMQLTVEPVKSPLTAKAKPSLRKRKQTPQRNYRKEAQLNRMKRESNHVLESNDQEN
ncbi:hypothetical protein HDE_03120 [Halotydeus destructor]|nr:hypothetical protein HDE_03120 [Halotydeus destructor]